MRAIVRPQDRLSACTHGKCHCRLACDPDMRSCLGRGSMLLENEKCIRTAPMLRSSEGQARKWNLSLPCTSPTSVLRVFAPRLQNGPMSRFLILADIEPPCQQLMEATGHLPPQAAASWHLSFKTAMVWTQLRITQPLNHRCRVPRKHTAPPEMAFHQVTAKDDLWRRQGPAMCLLPTHQSQRSRRTQAVRPRRL